MPAIDFTTALARLLQDGLLRNRLIASPESVIRQMELCETDRVALLALNAEDLEFQAQVLLHKRFDALRRVIPKTCEHLSDKTWPLFYEFARNYWPKDSPATAFDAYAFCSRVKRVHPSAVNKLEWNRLRFAFSRSFFATNLLRRNATQTRVTLQILFKLSRRRWHEVLIVAKL